MKFTDALPIMMKAVSRWSAAAGPVCGRIREFFLFNPLERLLPAKAVCAEISDSGCLVTSAERKWGKLRFGPSVRAAGTGPEEVARAVKGLAAAGGRAGRVVLTVPRSWTVTACLELPRTARENLAQVVAYELDRFTPFSSADAFYDFKVIDEGVTLKLFLGAARAGKLDPYLNAFRKEGLDAAAVAVGIEAIGSLFPENTIFVKVNGSGYEGAIFRRGTISHMFARETEKGGPGPLAEDVRELVKMLPEGKGGPRLALDADAALVRQWAGSLPLPPQPAGSIGKDRSPEARKIGLAALGSLTGILGGGPGPVNLAARGRHAVAKPLAATAVLAVIAAALGTLLLVSPLQFEGKRIDELDVQISLRKDEVRKAEALRREKEAVETEIARINDFRHSRPPAVAVIRELNSLLPKNAWLVRLHMTDTAVEIEGYAGSASEVLQKLEDSRFLKKIEYSSPTFRDSRLKADRFALRAELVTAGGKGAHENARK